MDYIGTILIAIIALEIGYVWGGIMMRRKIMKFVSEQKVSGASFKNECSSEKDEALYMWWDGYYICADVILEEFSAKRE